ncbi:hypothetical protein [Exercitatus varius]|uniref:hypothetical protein n=1 Tax=Exercitatus varius TaxID=67857 RepID=UPI00294ABBB0|nr:hypothetical protein [Exercitatus varius]MDG2941365.1 hypothetical protein [Exercitatus varius]
MDIKCINYLENHYFFNDNSHTMDAHIFNKCEYEILLIIREIAAELGVKDIITLEILPLEDGGLVRWLKARSYSDIIATLTLIVAIIPIVLSQFPSELEKLEVEKAKLEIQLLKKQLSDLDEKIKEQPEVDVVEKVTELVESSSQYIMQNPLIRKRISNYYKSLVDYEKITKVSYISYDKNKDLINSPKFVHKDNFLSFIFEAKEILDIDENARIHIYSPSLVKGKHKWKGYYEKAGIVIDFSMLDKDFKKSVENGEVDFRNGSMIDGVLQTKIKFDEFDNEVSRTYSIITVLNKIDGNVFIETKQGKKYREHKKFLENQGTFEFL